jgi:hypothetical protein
MKQRTSSLPVLVVVAVVALVLGSIGTAVASPALNKGAVKKIATKVVKKQAPSLSVASAANATNATNLAGKGAASYLNQATVYTSATAVGATTHTIVLPLAPGNYTIGYSVLLAGGSGYSFCNVSRIRPATPALAIADDTSQTTASAPSSSGFGAVSVLAGDTVQLQCNSATAFTIPAGQPAQIVVSPVDTLTTVAPLTAARGTAGRAN